jgi:hypothetical protein
LWRRIWLFNPLARAHTLNSYSGFLKARARVRARLRARDWGREYGGLNPLALTLLILLWFLKARSREKSKIKSKS